MQVNVLEAKNRLSQLIQSARAGEPVIIANRGKPVAQLVAADMPSPNDRATGGGLLEWLAAHPLPAHARRDRADIEAAIKAERSAWE